MKISYLKSMMVALALVVTITACEKDDDPVPVLPYEDVFGDWDWHSTEITEYDDLILADSVDYSQSLKITSSGQYTWTKEDSTLFDSEFQIMEDSTVMDREVFIFEFEDSSMSDQSFYIKQKDTLYLNEECEECDKHIFVRK